MFSCSDSDTVTNEIDIIPRPVEMHRRTGVFTLSDATSIDFDAADAGLARIAGELSETVRVATGYAPVKNSNISKSNIRLAIDPDIEGDEAYHLTVKKGRITISGSTHAGVYYGMVTLKQLLPDDFGARDSYRGRTVTIRSCTIKDRPRFAWRGVMLDVARHFQPKDSVKRFIDILAYHKINKFHWHLSDHQGWRIEIDKYPLLTEKGSWRQFREQGVQWRDPLDSVATPHGGYYTKDDIREIVEYAAAKHITVIPEIEVPGHSKAALECYPEYVCDGGTTAYGVLCPDRNRPIRSSKTYSTR